MNTKVRLYIRSVCLSILLMLSFQACQSPATFLSKVGQMECKYIGFTHRLSKSYRKYEKLKRKAIYQELVEYTQNESIILRAYAHWALVENFQDQYIELFEQILRDSTQLTVRCGDTSRARTIASSSYILYMEGKRSKYEKGMDYPIYNENERIKDQIAMMDSLILTYLPDDCFALEQAIINREYHSDTILRNIIHLAFQEDIGLAGQYIKKHWNKASFKHYQQVVKSVENDSLSIQGKKLFDEIINIAPRKR